MSDSDTSVCLTCIIYERPESQKRHYGRRAAEHSLRPLRRKRPGRERGRERQGNGKLIFALEWTHAGDGMLQFHAEDRKYRKRRHNLEYKRVGSEVHYKL